MKNLLVIFIWIFVSVPLYAQERGIRVEKPTGRKFAFLVGVTEYEQSDAFSKLIYSVKDVDAWRRQLEKIGFESRDIIVMASNTTVSRQPAKRKILASMNELLQNTTENDIIICVFSGHGTQINENPYFCPEDARIDDLAGSCISLNDVLDDLKKAPAKFKWLVVDACRNDPSRSSRNGMKSIGRVESVPKGVTVLFSCAETEKSYEDTTLRHGVFTHFLMQGLSGKAADQNGCITILDLYKYVEQNTREYVKTRYDTKQVPYWDGEFTNFTLRDDLLIEGASREQWQKADESYRKAVTYRRNKDYERASSEIMKSLAILPKKREFLDERELIDLSLKIANRTKAEAYAKSAINYLNNNEYQKATTEIENALNLFPDDSGYLGTKHAIYLKYMANSEVRKPQINPQTHATASEPSNEKIGESPPTELEWYETELEWYEFVALIVVGIVVVLIVDLIIDKFCKSDKSKKIAESFRWLFWLLCVIIYLCNYFLVVD